MSLNHKTLYSLFDDTADAIRRYSSSGAVIKADEFPEAIDSMAVKVIGNAYQPKSMSGAPVVSFANGAKDIPIKSATFAITPVQSGTGDPSPTNVRPISGWTGANIHNTRYGIFPVETEKVVDGYYVLAIKNTRIRKTYTGTTANNFLITGAQVSEVFTGYQNSPAGSYSFKGAVSSSKGNVTVTARFATAAGENPKDVVLNGAAVEVPEGHLLLNITMSVDSWSADDWVQLDDFVLAIDPVDYPVSWQSEAGTVYGGTLRDNGDGTWTLTVTHGISAFSGGDWVLVTSGGNTFFQRSVNVPTSLYNTAICNQYKAKVPSASNLDDFSFGFLSNGQSLRIKDTRFETVADFKAHLADGNQIYYPLATPVSYTLAAASVRTLLGENNIFADVGDCQELTYYRDPLSLISTDTIENVPVASFSDGADDIPVKSLTVNIVPVQAAGTPTPEAPLPISGWTGANIVRAGKNILPFGIPVIGNSAWSPENTMLIKAGAYTVSFTSTTIASWRIGVKIYSLSGTDVGNDESYKPIFDSAASYNSARGIWGFPGANVTAQHFAFTLPKDCRVAFCLWGSGISSGTVTGGMVEIGINPNPVYEAYKGTTYPVSWQTEAGTVYGGTLRDKGDGTWTLTATWAGVDLAALSWTADTEHGTFSSSDLRTGSAYKYIQKIMTTASASLVARVEKYNPISLNDMTTSYPNNSFAVSAVGNIIVKADASPSGFLAYLIQNGQTLDSYTLTAESVKTLLGNNNIFADTGDIVSLIYRVGETAEG